MSETGTAIKAKPIWVDLASPDVDASTAFYSGLFGWERVDLGPEAGGYKLMNLDGKVAAAVNPLSEGQYPAWTVYFGTGDAAGLAGKVEAAGGKVVMPAFAVLDAGTMAVFQDPGGAFFSVWQPDTMKGFDVAQVANSFGWAELNTRDLKGAEAFYPKVFGWGIDHGPMGDNSSEAGMYTMWTLDGEQVGGGFDMAGMPAEVPAMWLVYFAVPDVDAAAAKVKELGGSVAREPADYPGGRFAVVSDVNGSVFAIMRAG